MSEVPNECGVYWRHREECGSWHLNSFTPRLLRLLGNGKRDLFLWEMKILPPLGYHPLLIWQCCHALSQTLPWINFTGEQFPDPKALGKNIPYIIHYMGMDNHSSGIIILGFYCICPCWAPSGSQAAVERVGCLLLAKHPLPLSLRLTFGAFHTLLLYSSYQMLGTLI